MSPSLVIFDCDGVLVDSELLACDCCAQVLSARGFPTAAQEVLQRYVGRSAASMMADLAERHGRPVPDDVRDAVRETTLARLAAELQPI
ncbi:HAD hydrolase-like protein, partial [Salmonella enterica]|uniref:HAD hydrolase-like protein n=1 Tax=Salmonella enterica TaxID=28901 RepID=UPI003FA6CE7C